MDIGSRHPTVGCSHSGTQSSSIRSGGPETRTAPEWTNRGHAVGPGVVNLTTFTLDSNGYWLVGSDGGVFAFGESGFWVDPGSLEARTALSGTHRRGRWSIGAPYS